MRGAVVAMVVMGRILLLLFEGGNLSFASAPFLL
jgi:hypothetical protein